MDQQATLPATSLGQIAAPQALPGKLFSDALTIVFFHAKSSIACHISLVPRLPDLFQRCTSQEGEPGL